MKLDLCLERQGGLVLIAWARETKLGVYMGVRFSPEVENLSYFSDGQRQLLRFPLAPDGRRKREDIPLEARPPIASIEHCELLLERVVDVSDKTPSGPPGPKAFAGTTGIIIPEAYWEGSRYLCYDAYIVRNGYTQEFVRDKESNPALDAENNGSPPGLFPLACFPEHSLGLLFWRQPSP